MIVVVAALVGSVWGGLLARRRGGNRKDIAQYAAVFGIIGGVLGVFVTLVLERMML